MADGMGSALLFIVAAIIIVSFGAGYGCHYLVSSYNVNVSVTKISQ